MEADNKLPAIWAGVRAAVKSFLSRIVGVREGLSFYEAYKESTFNRGMASLLEDLEIKLNTMQADPSQLFSEEWLKTEEGESFARKVFDSAIDPQLADKQTLFVNALINGALKKETTYREKLRFVDILRNLSAPTLEVLAEMHLLYKDGVRGLGRKVGRIEPYRLVDSVQVAEDLGHIFEDPFLVVSAVSEMESQGLFSRTGEWIKGPDGKWKAQGGFDTNLTYSDFTYRFVEFITDSWPKKKG